MKKVFLGVGVILCTMASAQSAPGLRFGIKAGGNLSGLTNTKKAAGMDMQSKTGFHAGVMMNAPIARCFSIQPEVLYSGQGAKEKNSNVRLRWNLGYINVPVMFRYHATPGVYIEAGPEVGLLTSSKFRYKFEGESMTEDAKKGTKSFSFGMGLGAGYRFTPNLSINARYTAGFSDIIKKNTDAAAVKNRSTSLGIGYTF
ncbi:porin family protein [Niabella drilacis]|uniref:Outer membrane protein beta-barrel domain-containing protein n=1 Tax=Niabella drilacis (strain DSM 25811 / CCM 8410 / CCUG 62505 / LMG 26954 / E90) TaxID=1285928 RepID=A0A1G6TW86_NIADE|nr:porin family protein [Niabella drilacis]SDD32627.1 Outer membrane protein beta-barrel domain-containing protein [Niabella drilacis]